MEAQGTISTREMRDLLVPTHLHYDLGTKSLKVRAFAEVLTKILYYSNNNKASLQELISEAAHISNVKRISDKHAVSALNFLNEKGIVRVEKNELWHLTEEGKKKVLSDIVSSNRKLESILDNYFGTKIERTILIKWFRHAAAHFFGVYNDIWTQTLYSRDLNSTPSLMTLEKTLAHSIKKFRLESHAEDLIIGFRSFIDNYRDPLVNEQIWSFAQAMLSARLITASIGPDPITINEFKNARVFLDTNTLFLAALEESKTSEAFTELTLSLNTIGTTIHILPQTVAEYRRVIDHKEKEIIKALTHFPLEVVVDSNDAFVRSAVARGCKDPESAKAFFDSIRDPLEQFHENAEVICEENEEILKAAHLATKDEKRLKEISGEWTKDHTISKTKNSTIHDAALDGAVELIRKRGQRAWILTRDTSMQNLSNRWTGNENLPMWLSLDALIQILAVSSTGPSHDSNNYKPLLCSLIKKEMHPSDGTFQIEDLSELIDLEERVRELDKNQIKIFANKIAKLRISGRSRNDSELQLEIRRTFNRKKIDHGEAVKSLQKEIISKEEDIEKMASQNKSVQHVLIDRLAMEEFNRIVFSLVGMTTMLVGTGLGLIYLGIKLPIEKYPILVPVLISLGSTEILIPTIKWLLPGFRSAKKQARERASKKAEKLVERKKMAYL